MYKEQEALRRDEEARTRIGNDLDTSFLVEAGAGSGKTTSIVGRMIALMKSGKAEARHIAAITFMNKAAAELLGRFRMRLEREYAEAGTEAERERLGEALRQVPECFIGTIHSFCGKLLRERPVEAGLDPSFREIDELEERELRESSWDQYLTALREEGDTAALDELLALQVHAEDLKDVYERVSQYEDVAIYTEETERPDFKRIRDELLPMLAEAAPHIPANEPEKGWDPLQKAIRHALRYADNKDMNDDMNILALAGAWDRNLGVTLNRWNDKEAAKRCKEAFQSWRTAVLQPFLQQWREYLHPKVVSFVLPAVRYNRERRIREGRLSFQDLLVKAAELLRSDAAVRRYFARRYRVLFVDEFQDTDPIQAEMMLLLTGADPEESDWRKLLPRPGSLFVVGDPKQSIYRFRRADISTYNLVKSKLAASGAVLQLTRNFRSVKAIGDYVNYAFESKFAAPDSTSDDQAPFVRMLTALPNPSAAAARKALFGVYTAEVPKQAHDRQADIAGYDAARAAAFIAWACAGNMTVAERDDAGKPVARPAAPGDFLILLKHRRHIALYAQWLEHYGLPADTSGSVAMTEELAAVRRLVGALNDSADTVSLLAVLRGKLFGISDDELYHYRREGGRIHLFSEADEGALGDKGWRVEEALRKLREYRQWTRSLPALAAFSRMLADIGLVAATAGGDSPGGAIRSGTLIKLLETLQLDPEASLDWAALTRSVVRLTEEEGLEAGSLLAGSGAAVRIMNLHKAKGLEAPAVWLACPCGDYDHDASEHVDRLSEPPLGYFTISRQRDLHTKEVIAQPVGWTGRGETERLFMHAEKDRLLYVAATRAKQLLVVSSYSSRPAIDPWSRLGESLQHQLELEHREAQPAVREELAAGPDAAQWRAATDAWLRAAALPTYRIDSVTGLAKAGGSGWGEVRTYDEVGAANGAGEEAVAAREGGLSDEHFVGGGNMATAGEGDGAKLAAAMEEGRASRGGGMAYGTLVHRCLQAVGEGMDLTDLPLYCKLVAEEEGVEAPWQERAEAAVRQTMQSELWQRSMAAMRKYFEFSFMTAQAETGAEKALLLSGQAEEGGALARMSMEAGVKPSRTFTSLLRGVIDLVFEEEQDGWVMADFKTDHYDRPEQEEALVAYYRPQVLAYAEQWRRMTGGQVKEAGLYFVRTGRYVAL